MVSASDGTKDCVNRYPNLPISDSPDFLESYASGLDVPVWCTELIQGLSLKLKLSDKAVIQCCLRADILGLYSRFDFLF